ncbi:alpha/beta hydrolase [Flammeovirga pacifica]|uniref:Serine aminopeptidase S33 domain-containing protein n=1 Tax=Flammeovirga pacifica TaxID=915059 RepID=A0A1S1YTI2_FLAPC|nr:alpha/beta hydrolase [Flammeovirga pacifica]OHX64337.1 hypothetical protein NH26_22350 [Flammeovirga pacifica]
MRKLIKITVILFISIYSISLGWLYFNQESLIFFPEKLAEDYRYHFENQHEEINFTTKDGHQINSLFFKSDSSFGLVFFLHGNSGSLKDYGYMAPIYLKHQYDVLMIDYRGFGKSSGEIISQEQLFDDHQMIYDEMKKEYDESKIIILGYSIGTGMSSYLASKNKPSKLILLAPYYGLASMMHNYYPYVPSFLLKYKLATYEYLEESDFPIYIFHGRVDNVIPIGQSNMLKEKFPTKIDLIILENQDHNNINKNPVYQSKVDKILED